MEQTLTPAAAQAATDLSFYRLFMEADLFVQGIMFLLLVMSILSWTVWFAKSRQFRVMKKQANRFEQAFWNGDNLEDLYRNTPVEEADHPMAKVFVVGLKEWESGKGRSKSAGGLSISVADRIRQLMNVTMLREMEKLESSMPMLATIGSTAPFIGLLGTVWGIMNSFQSIGAAKNTSLAVVAPGIAEALLATAIGLFAAIPAVMAYNRLTTELGRYANRMEAFMTEFLSLVEHQSDNNGGGSSLFGMKKAS